RGYDIAVLAEKAQFEEVAFLLQYGELPTREELAQYKARLKALRRLPEPLARVLESIPASSHPMDVLRTACSFLGNLEPEVDFSQQDACIERLVALLPAAICYWWHHAQDGRRI